MKIRQFKKLENINLIFPQYLAGGIIHSRSQQCGELVGIIYKKYANGKTKLLFKVRFKSMNSKCRYTEIFNANLWL